MGTPARQKQESLDFVSVLSSVQGMRLLRRVMGVSGVFGLSYAGENTHASAFNEGRRSVGLYLLSQTAAYAPDKLAELVEGNPDARNRASLKSAAPGVKYGRDQYKGSHNCEPQNDCEPQKDA